MIRNKNKLRRRYKKYGMADTLAELKNLRAEIKRVIKNEHSNYVKTIELEIKTNPKSFWGYINRMKSADKPSTMLLDGRKVEGGAAIVEALAEYFGSVYDPCGLDPDQKRHRALYLRSPVMENVSPFAFAEITVEEVLRALKKLKPRRLTGPDGIPPYIFKACADLFTIPLLHLFNLSVKNNSFPEEWKRSKIIPLPKKGVKYEIKIKDRLQFYLLLPKFLNL